MIVASSFAFLVIAFVIGGMREIGEPARKAMIVDFAEDDVRVRSVGLYYLVRSHQLLQPRQSVVCYGNSVQKCRLLLLV